VNPIKIILINGKKRSGKDHFAKVLQKELSSIGKTSEILSFADVPKDILCTALNISKEEFNDFKNSSSELTAEFYGSEIPICNFRKLIQRFATEAMQHYFGEDVWVKLLIERAIKFDTDFILVPDFRFIPEAIDDGITVRIRNDEVDKKCKDEHRSENGLGGFKFNYTINNSGKPDLTDSVREFIKQILRERSEFL
jgi:hypothetical protein